MPSRCICSFQRITHIGPGDVTPGQKLTKERKCAQLGCTHFIESPNVESGPTPTVTVTPANSSVTLTGRFTIAMVDADVVGSDLSKGVNRHWLVNGVSVTGTSCSPTINLPNFTKGCISQTTRFLSHLPPPSLPMLDPGLHLEVALIGSLCIYTFS